MKILITDNIAGQAIDMLRKEFDVELRISLTESDLIKLIPSYDILIVRSSVKVTDKVIKAAKSLKLIARPGVGVDNIDTNTAKQAGIPVINTPLGNVNAAAEHTIAIMLSLARHIPKAYISLKNNRQWERKKFIGVEFKGKTLGVIGLGNVGKIVARIARKGLLMNVLAYDPTDRKKDAEELDINLASLDEIYEKSDIITLHVPLIEQTRNMLSEKEFQKMKNGIYIINAARGGLIDEKALYDNLKSGKISGAAIDVWEKEPCTDSPLFELENVLPLPHLGASTIEAQENVAIDIAGQIIDAAKTGRVQNSVNGIKKLRQ